MTVHRAHVWLAFLVVSFGTLSLLVSPTQAEDHPPGELPLKRIVLFTSGVGFFEHSGEIEGNRSIEMRFNVEDVNDLLKSMVLQDRSGGGISTVSYGSKDPITKTLKTFTVDLTREPTLAELLRQIRGEKVQLQSADKPEQVTGTIVGVERRQKPGKEATVEIDVLNVFTATGLRSIPLESVMEIRLLDEKLNAELAQALTIIAQGHATDKKTVTLNFQGKGKRPVRVGYIQESPVWKTSYRLVIADDQPPYLQGWAIVENTSEQDWSDVALTLVSGRPISFIMDLYQPMYVDRQVVMPELYASLRPRIYDQDLVSADAHFRALGRGAIAAGQKPVRDTMPIGSGLGGGAAGGMGGGGGYFGGGRMPISTGREEQVMDAGGRSAAITGEVGELFRYKIETPVTLHRQKSSMLPIVNDSIKGEKVSIYNRGVHAKHPLNGLKFTNTTDLHLMQGPITVFDGGEYAGDARIEDLAPGADRLISYALDLDTEVAPTSGDPSQQIVNVRIAKGLLLIQHKHTRSQDYVVKNSGSKRKKLLVEHPLDFAWKVISPKDPTETTRSVHRFVVMAEPGKPGKLSIVEEQMTSEQIALTNLDDKAILLYQSTKVVSNDAKAALAEILPRKEALAAAGVARQQLEQQLRVIDEEQSRMRNNMTVLDRTSDLYLRYVKKFAEQEDQVDKLRQQVRDAVRDENRLRKALDDYLAGLDLS